MIAKRILAPSLFSSVARFSAILACALAANFTVAAPADPWSPAQTVQPAPLVAELQDSQHPHPLVIYVGVRTLFAGAHVVLYCGCCPLEKCPNLRPAFSALKDFPLARLRVLILPNSFSADWAEKGFPVQKGS